MVVGFIETQSTGIPSLAAANVRIYKKNRTDCSIDYCYGKIKPESSRTFRASKKHPTVSSIKRVETF